jgi:hypothetical protein
MAILFRQFGVSDKLPSKIEIEKPQATAKEILEIVHETTGENVFEIVSTSSGIREEYVLLKNGSNIFLDKGWHTMAKSGDVLTILVLTVGG